MEDWDRLLKYATIVAIMLITELILIYAFDRALRPPED